MKKVLISLFALTGLLVFSGAASAALIEIGTANYLGSDYNLIYDDVQSLVWLDYTKGEATWQNQKNWASGLGASLTVSLDPLYTTDIDWSTGWRLPSTDESKANLDAGFGWEGPDENGYHNYSRGYNMVNSEMGHLYYDFLGNLGYYDTEGNSSQAGWGLNNTGPFDNLLAYFYWSDTEYSLNTDWAWLFFLSTGSQARYDKVYISYNGYGLAVHPGQVSPIPEPATVLLLGSGLVGLAGFRRKRRL